MSLVERHRNPAPAGTGAPMRAVAPMRAASRAPVRVLYVGGTGRSGSTLLDRLLGEVPGLVSCGELVHLWARGLAGNERCGCGQPFHDCSFWSEVGRVAFGGWDRVDSASVLRLQRSVDRNRFIPLMLVPGVAPGFHRRMRRYGELLGRLYEAVREVSGAEVVVDSSKHASYAFLLRRVPGVDVRLVHLIRDARGVAYSHMKKVERPEVTAGRELMARATPGRSGVRWLAYNALFHLLSAAGVPRARMRYESLVSAPRAELGRALRVAGRAGSERDDLGFVRGRTVELRRSHTVAGNPMRFASGPVRLRHDDEWHDRMPRRDRVAASLASWPLLLLYGYARRLGARR